MNEETKEVLKRLRTVSGALEDLLENGVSEALIAVINRQMRKLRKQLRRLLRKQIGKPRQSWSKWVGLAKILVDSAIGWILVRSR